MGIYRVKKAFGHYAEGAVIQLSAGEAEKYKEFLEAYKPDNKKAASGGSK